MKILRIEKDQKEKRWALLFPFSMFFLYFLYLLLHIDTQLFYQSQQPVFFFDKDFYKDFFSYPGGPVDLLSRFLSQFYYYSWTGAFLIILITSLIVWNGIILINQKNNQKQLLFFQWLPFVFLIAIFSEYRHPLAFTLGLLFILFCLNIYLRIKIQNLWGRFFFFLISFVFLYYSAGGLAFLFSVSIIIIEILYFHCFYTFPLILLVSLFVPFIGANWFFILKPGDAFTKNIIFNDLYFTPWLPWIFLLFYPILLILLSLNQKISNNRLNERKKLSKIYAFTLRNIYFQSLIIFLLVTISALFSFDKTRKTLYSLNYFARHGDWESVIEIGKSDLENAFIVQYQVNRALYHSGRLCDDLFSFSGISGAERLFMHNSIRHLFPLEYSDLFYDLGLINEAQHWAHEALSVTDDSPWNLQRIAVVNIIKGEYAAAEKCLEKLNKTFWFKSWSQKYKKIDEKSDIIMDEQLTHLKNMQVEDDFIVSTDEPQACLDELLKNNQNQMAFEYSMILCLLEGKVGRFIKNLYRFKNFGYSRIPRHFEEAILLYILNTGRRDINLPGYQISQETALKFRDFSQILDKHNNDKNAAHFELKQKYSNTYWYYVMYIYKSKES